MLPGPCRLLQSLFSHPSSRDGLSRRCGSLVPLILPEGSRPQPFDAVQGSPGVRPELVIRWVQAMLVATLVPSPRARPSCLGVRCLGEGHRVLLVLVLFAAPGSPSRCRCFFHLSCPFFCLVVLPPRARCLPAQAGTLSCPRHG